MSWRALAGGYDAARWLEARTGCVLTREAKTVAVLDNSGVIRGVVGFDDWTHTGAQAHVAVDTPVAARTLVRESLRYLFRQARRSVMMGLVPASNAKSVQLAQRLGMRETYRVTDGWAQGVDLLLFELRREDAEGLMA